MITEVYIAAAALMVTGLAMALFAPRRVIYRAGGVPPVRGGTSTWMTE